MLDQFVELKNANTVENSKDRIREWLSKYGVETGKIPEEEITKMVNELKNK